LYKLTCPDCNRAYVGQIGRSFSTRFREYMQGFRNNSGTSNFTKHLSVHAHSFGSIHSTMQMLQNQRKGPHLNTLEKYHIHEEASRNNHLNDDHTVVPNKIFEAIQKIQKQPQLPSHPNTL
jgi:hypothetical protein